jgi:hypothetical protein
MHITTLQFYSGAREKLNRLGLADALIDLQLIILNTHVETDETPHAAAARAVHGSLNTALANSAGWSRQAGGQIWTKEIRNHNTFAARVGVKSVIGTRKELLIPRILRIRNMLQKGIFDVGVIIVPNDRFSSNLSNRCTSLSDALQVIERDIPEATRVPILLAAVAPDGAASRDFDLNGESRTFEAHCVYIGDALTGYAKRY